VKEIKVLFKASVAKEDWPLLINACSSMVAFLSAFPERTSEFQDIIIELI